MKNFVILAFALVTLFPDHSFAGCRKRCGGGKSLTIIKIKFGGHAGGGGGGFAFHAGGRPNCGGCIKKSCHRRRFSCGGGPGCGPGGAQGRGFGGGIAFHGRVVAQRRVVAGQMPFPQGQMPFPQQPINRPMF